MTMFGSTDLISSFPVVAGTSSISSGRTMDRNLRKRILMRMLCNICGAEAWGFAQEQEVYRLPVPVEGGGSKAEPRAT